MTQLGYHTVFAIGWHSFPWSSMGFFVLPVLLGLALFRFSGGKQIWQGVGAVIVVLSLFFLLLVSMSTVSVFMKDRHAYVTGSYSVVEGRVENFRPMHTPGPEIESFSVNGVTFSYNVISDTCFNDAHPHGIIRSGLDVRIFYTDGCILRLDVRQ
ncbi:MAG: hypothetical protein ACYDD2_14840 [Candidatus Acidiferrales bacterium]